MKKNMKLAFAAFALLAFTACGTDNNTATESDTSSMPTDASMGDDISLDMEEDTTVVLQDTTVKDGVVDEIPEEQP
ncbi:hypothetical protein FVR03_23115 [Pontibacter qinzhouensis]|uniref:Uncharacterized protein n=1 Tax=Pontibacter qinzhouensis TaxID=2603253 RepID=A0A5C8IK60_9BACT|nr:hypothetical protein [Pontibacter qinzhouensis]TXK22053.1 hypothetical protein FVR03_23115 [Pontibacter qinzhouensis]